MSLSSEFFSHVASGSNGPFSASQAVIASSRMRASPSSVSVRPSRTNPSRLKLSISCSESVR